jgi:biopolymer transport protein ExbB
MIERTKDVMVGFGASWVLWLLMILSVVSLAIMLERAWVYWTLREDIDKLVTDLGKLLRSGDRTGAKALLEKSPSAEAAVVLAGLIESDHGADSAEEAMMGAAALQKSKLETRLAVLGTLGNNAPFIGLLGTVIGILGAFDELKKSMSSAGSQAQMAGGGVMGSIAEALVATAVGLLVAIPAVAAFNSFQRIVKTILTNTDALSHVLLAHLRADEPVLATGAKESELSKKETTKESKKDSSKKSSNEKKADSGSSDDEEEAKGA